MCTHHDVEAETADEVGRRFPAQLVEERRAEERVAGVQLDDGRAVRERARPFPVHRAPHPRETAETFRVLVEVRVHVVGVQHGQPEVAGRGRRADQQQTERYHRQCRGRRGGRRGRCLVVSWSWSRGRCLVVVVVVVVTDTVRSVGVLRRARENGSSSVASRPGPPPVPPPPIRDNNNVIIHDVDDDQ